MQESIQGILKNPQKKRKESTVMESIPGILKNPQRTRKSESSHTANLYNKPKTWKERGKTRKF